MIPRDTVEFHQRVFQAGLKAGIHGPDDPDSAQIKAIDRVAQAIATDEVREIERAILEGANRITRRAPLTNNRTVYTVPKWRKNPMRRFRVERARWLYRHGLSRIASDV